VRYHLVTVSVLSALLKRISGANKTEEVTVLAIKLCNEELHNLCLLRTLHEALHFLSGIHDTQGGIK
jgi:hypothetical protein